MVTGRRTAAAENPAGEEEVPARNTRQRNPCPARLEAAPVLVGAVRRVAQDGEGAGGRPAMVGRPDPCRPGRIGPGGAGAVALGAGLVNPRPGVEVAATETAVPRLLGRAPRQGGRAADVGLPAEAYVGVGAGATRADRRPGEPPPIRLRLVAPRLHVERLPVTASS